jgi:hypothetical protein
MLRFFPKNRDNFVLVFRQILAEFTAEHALALSVIHDDWIVVKRAFGQLG